MSRKILIEEQSQEQNLLGDTEYFNFVTFGLRTYFEQMSCYSLLFDKCEPYPIMQKTLFKIHKILRNASYAP